jgi:hypothetical protein
MPFSSGRAGCGAYRHNDYIAPHPCQRPPVWVGLRFSRFPAPGHTAIAFACDEHRGELTAPRRLLDRDRATLARRAEQTRRGLAGEPGWEPDPPLATGAAARALIERARAWAQQHPEEAV